MTRLIRESIEYVVSSKTLRNIRKMMKIPSYYPSKRTISLLSMILLSWTLYRVDILIIDHNLTTKSDLEFINGSLRILGKKLNVKFCASTQEKGIFLADFVAGLAKYIVKRGNFKITTTNTNIYTNCPVSLRDMDTPRKNMRRRIEL